MDHKNLLTKIKLILIFTLFINIAFSQTISPFSNLPTTTICDTLHDKIIYLHWDGSKYSNALIAPNKLKVGKNSGAGSVDSIVLNTPSIIYTNPVNFTTSGGVATGTLSLSTQKPNTFLAGATSGTVTPTFRAIVAGDVPTLNQNTTGSAATVTTNANLTGPITSIGNATSVNSQTGTGSTFAMQNSPSFIGPNLGTPTGCVGTNITGTAAGLTAGNVTTNANLTGDITSVGNATTASSSIVKTVVLNTPSVIYTNPVTFTTSGNTATGTLTLANQNPHQFLATSSTTLTTTPTFRGIVDGDLTGVTAGNATNVNLTNENTVTTAYPVFSKTATGNSPLFTEASSLSYNPSIGTLTAFQFAGNLTGTVTGNVTGNAGTVTTNANLTGPITSSGNATSVASQTGTGSTFVMNTSPTLVTPNIGTPSAGVATNLTGTAAGLTAGNVTTNANLTGPITSVGNATSIASQTGTGTTFAMQTTPTFSTSITSPLIIGGTITTSPLTYKTTTGVGTTGADHIFQVGSNGATEAMRMLNNGNVGIGNPSPLAQLDLKSNAAAPTMIMNNNSYANFIEFNQTGQTVKGAMGALGHFEMNVSYNMDYHTGVHKYYDTTHCAIWSWYGNTGTGYQYAPRNRTNTGDIWANSGAQILWQVDTSGKSKNRYAYFTDTLAVKTTSPQGIAHFYNGSVIVNGTNGKVAIGKTNPQATLDCAGTARVNSLHSYGRIFSTNSAIFDDLSTTTGSIVMGYDTVNALGFIASKNYLATTSQPLQFICSTVLIGTTNQFQINPTGNIIKLNNVTTSFPASQGSANCVLTNDGSGNLTWTSASTRSWSLTGNTSTTPSTSAIGTAIGAGKNYIGTTDSIDFIIGTKNLERIRIAGNGNVGVGTILPPLPFSVINTGNFKTAIGATASIGGLATAPTTLSTSSYLQLGGTEYNANSYRLITFGYGDFGATQKAPMYLGYQETSVTGSTHGDFILGTRTTTTNVDPTERLRVTSAGLVGIGVSSPTALLHLAAGTATANTAPLQFNSGTVETSARAGLVEYDGTNLFATPNTTVGRWPVTINSVQYATPVTTNTVTATAGVKTLVCNPAGTLAALTITFPSSPVNGQTFGIGISQIITVLTLSAGANTIDGSIVSSATNSNGGWVYVASVTTWFKVH